MNRYEDERLAEGRFAAFTDKKERKLLASDYRRKKMDTCLQKVRAARHGVPGWRPFRCILVIFFFRSGGDAEWSWRGATLPRTRSY